MLLNTRKIKTEIEVEQDFINKQKRPDNQKSLHKNLIEIDKEVMENGEIGLNRHKAKNLLLPS